MSKLAREAQIDKQDHASFDEIMRILTELRSSWQRMLVDNGIV